mmetsp:Transcript_22973/g.78228  ORF Transcript_22973/g.78228 Transcript_22973/m.78228 type:complete len:229 (-) Transcript_22973:1969-2655(-)
MHADRERRTSPAAHWSALPTISSSALPSLSTRAPSASPSGIIFVRRPSWMTILTLLMLASSNFCMIALRTSRMVDSALSTKMLMLPPFVRCSTTTETFPPAPPATPPPAPDFVAEFVGLAPAAAEWRTPDLAAAGNSCKLKASLILPCNAFKSAKNSDVEAIADSNCKRPIAPAWKPWATKVGLKLPSQSLTSTSKRPAPAVALASVRVVACCAEAATFKSTSQIASS